MESGTASVEKSKPERPCGSVRPGNFGKNAAFLWHRRNWKWWGDLYFHQPSDPTWSHAGIVYFARNWTGEPRLSDEMDPRWFDPQDFPYSDMWMADRVWLPMILAGKKIRGTIYFAEDGETVYDYEFQEME